MKYFLLGVFCTLAILTLAVFGYIRFGFAEVRSDIPPSSFESSLMRAGVSASLRREAPNVPNPVSSTDANLIAGRKFYLNACSGCHGTPGKPFGKRGPILFPPIPGFVYRTPAPATICLIAPQTISLRDCRFFVSRV